MNGPGLKVQQHVLGGAVSTEWKEKSKKKYESGSLSEGGERKKEE